MSDSSIYKLLSAVMHDIGAIRKEQTNEYDRYKFRGIDDVYNAVQPALVKHGVTVAPQVEDITHSSYTTAKGAEMQHCILRVRYIFAAPDGSTIEVVVLGEGADRGDKSVNKAFSSAYKTAMFQTLCIPTDEHGKDSETDSPDLSDSKKTTKSTGKAPKKISDAQRKKVYASARERAAQLDESISEKDIIDSCKEAVGLESLNDLEASRVDGMLNFIAKWQPPSAEGF